MNIDSKTREQEERKKFLKCLLSSAVKDMEKPKRKTAKQQVREAKQELFNQIMIEMRDKKRSIPKEWERGFNAAMSVVERFIDKS